MIERLLVANRGEIARRVIATCRRAGISPVAVHSDADAGEPHVREADLAVRLPGSSPADTYLRADLIVAAARATGADAVHPGYGFGAEDPAYAAAILDAGLTWVGPAPDVIAAMADKLAAKARLAAVGVPVLPDLDPAALREPDLPVLVKAAAGGGGRGIRPVHRLADLAAAVASAGREAQAAFGDGRVFCEPLLDRARHVEVQVLADGHGTVWVLGERDCSVQRRHQKVLEETPAPGLDGATRRVLVEAAERAVRAIGYVGAGTVEFLVGADGRVAFLEVNTRLQVEHPVTECVTGLDLVALQLAVAEGTALPPRPPAARGHAVEVRLYAEDPAADWLPSTGPVHRLDVPGVDARFAVPAALTTTGGEGRWWDGAGSDRASSAPPVRPGAPVGTVLRVDAGVEPGSVVTGYYDGLLAKVIAWGPSREAALRRLTAALDGARLHGPVTGRDLLLAVLRDPQFRAGGADLGFLDRAEIRRSAAPDPRTVRLGALAAVLAAAAGRRSRAACQPAVPGGWRNVGETQRTVELTGPDGPVRVRYGWDRSGRLTVPADPADPAAGTGTGTEAGTRGGPGEPIEVLSVDGEAVELAVDGVRHRFTVATYPGPQDGAATVVVDSVLGSVRLTRPPRFPAPGAVTAAGSLLAPMPGVVCRVGATPGEAVSAGQPLLWLEAMKMEHAVRAPQDGVLVGLPVRVGEHVAVGTVLAVVGAAVEEGAAG